MGGWRRRFWVILEALTVALRDVGRIFRRCARAASVLRLPEGEGDGTDSVATQQK